MSKPLSQYEYNVLYQRAVTGSVKEAAQALGKNPHSLHHTTADAFAKLGVEDIISAFRKMGWLKPVPFNEEYDAYYDEHLQVF